MLETLSTQNTGKRERCASEMFYDREQDTSVEDYPMLGFMQSKIGSLACSKPRLMAQVHYSSSPTKTVKTHKLCYLFMPRGETPSSAVIDFELEDSKLPMKPKPEDFLTQTLVRADKIPEETDPSMMKLVEGSPSRAQMMSRGKSRTLEPSGLLLLKSLANCGTQPLKKEVNAHFLKGRGQESSNICLRKFSDMTIRSQRSILKQSATKQAENKRIKDFEDPKDSRQDSSFGEFQPLSSIKRVTFSKTNMLFLYSVNKNKTPIVSN